MVHVHTLNMLMNRLECIDGECGPGDPTAECLCCTKTCTAPKILSQFSCQCVCPSTTCTGGKIFNYATCTCNCPPNRFTIINSHTCHALRSLGDRVKENHICTCIIVPSVCTCICIANIHIHIHINLILLPCINDCVCWLLHVLYSYWDSSVNHCVGECSWVSSTHCTNVKCNKNKHLNCLKYSSSCVCPSWHNVYPLSQSLCTQTVCTATNLLCK